MCPELNLLKLLFCIWLILVGHCQPATVWKRETRDWTKLSVTGTDNQIAL